MYASLIVNYISKSKMNHFNFGPPLPLVRQYAGMIETCSFCRARYDIHSQFGMEHHRCIARQAILRRFVGTFRPWLNKRRVHVCCSIDNGTGNRFDLVPINSIVMSYL